MTWSLVVLLVIIVFIVSKILHLALPISPMLFWVTVPAFYILNTLAVLLASLQLVKGRERIFSVILAWSGRSEEHTSELQSLMRISYAVLCLKKKKKKNK